MVFAAHAGLSLDEQLEIQSLDHPTRPADVFVACGSC